MPVEIRDEVERRRTRQQRGDVDASFIRKENGWPLQRVRLGRMLIGATSISTCFGFPERLRILTDMPAARRCRPLVARAAGLGRLLGRLLWPRM